MTTEKRKWRVGVVCLLLILSTLIGYGQVRNHEFISFDDTSYITENPHVRQGLTLAGTAWAFTSVYVSNWHPLTWMSHMLDVALFGLNPGFHHLVSLLLHILNSLMLFAVLHRMTHALWQSAFVALLFALHPLHVESVAWAAERKDVLSGLFWMLTMGAYALYVEKPGPVRYGALVVSFAMGLMAKPMLVTLPFVLLLLDYWPLNRFAGWAKRKPEGQALTKGKVGRGKKGVAAKAPSAAAASQSPARPDGLPWRALVPAVKEKAPLFLLAIMSCAMTVYAQKDEAVVDLNVLSLGERIGNALVAYVKYLGMTLCPVNLSFFYPLPDAMPLWQPIVAALLLLALTGIVLRARRKVPYGLVGWLWFLGSLIPVIGLVQVGDQALADRYTYLTLTGLFILAAWGLADLMRMWSHGRIAVAAVSMAILLVLTGMTYRQVSHWQNSSTLAEHAIAATGKNYLAQGMLGLDLAKQGRVTEAYTHFQEALRINPDFTRALHNFGLELAKQGRTEEAAARFREVLAVDPGYAEARFNLAYQLSKLGRTEEAVAQYREGLQFNPDAVAWGHLGGLLAGQGKSEEALAAFQSAVRLNPGSAKAHFDLAVHLALRKRVDEAVSQYREVLRINPDSMVAHNNLGNLLAKQGRMDEATDHFRAALRIAPNDIAAHGLLGEVYYQQGQYALARGEFEAVLRLNPGNRDAQRYLASMKGR